ncbi:AAA family ATPase, partial [Roseibium sp.]|uniref:AAA family ATPase n=1 Tax=Roseibium sp. TaxID=1936156 RepID=UPI00329A37C7
MLVTLAIRDIVLIDRLDLDFSNGMSVLTGETGAGKSILLDSLSLAIGGRGDADLVRHGESQGQVTGVFDVPGDHAVRQLLRENDVEDDGDIILRRVQTSDGRTRAFVNDQPVSVGLMKQAGALLVEIHGQHDDRALVDPESHRQLVDSFAGLHDDVERVGDAYSTYRQAEKAVRDHTARIETARQEADYLKAAVDELTRLAPVGGEEEDLATRRTTMMQVEKIAGDLNDAFETLNGGASPIPELSSLLRRMERKADQVPHLLNAPVRALASALDSLEDARGGLETSLRETDFDPRELETGEE